MYMGLLFMGEVEKQTIDGIGFYEVCFALVSNPNRPDCVEIYRTLGPNNETVWKQVADNYEAALASPGLCEVIGQQIQIQEHIDAK